ncbi:Uncharacterised protein [Candidatus Gugararchaeum adminiculabundum]|nr:Uncharacterised protein [Candidatus Gugararchaeum adminiculabundum]
MKINWKLVAIFLAFTLYYFLVVQPIVWKVEINTHGVVHTEFTRIKDYGVADPAILIVIMPAILLGILFARFGGSLIITPIAALLACYLGIDVVFFVLWLLGSAPSSHLFIYTNGVRPGGSSQYWYLYMEIALLGMLGYLAAKRFFPAEKPS